MKRHSAVSLTCDRPAKVGKGTLPSPDRSGSLNNAEHAVALTTALDRSAAALASGAHVPELAIGSLSGTYFLLDPSGRKVGVFKPSDEEPGLPNNPHGVTSLDDMPDPIYNGLCKVGEASIKEVAAYLLDARSGHFTGVSPTTIASFSHPGFCDIRVESDEMKNKTGSFQLFLEHDCEAADLGSGLFSPHDVFKIGVFDIRTLNCDRHSGNILARRHGEEKMELIPIDHAFILPERICSVDFEWLNYPQAKLPFDEETLEYIRNLNAEDDAKMLKKKLDVSPASLRTLKACTLLLKKGADAGLTLYDIGMLFASTEKGTSWFEEMYLTAEEESSAGQELMVAIGSPTAEFGDAFFLNFLDQRIESFLEVQLRHTLMREVDHVVTIRNEVENVITDAIEHCHVSEPPAKSEVSPLLMSTNGMRLRLTATAH